MKVYEYHEIANIFPMMQDDEYERLKDDIAINGQLEPIVLYENKILDGRNRYRALCELGLKPNIKEYEGDQPLSYVISKNLHRRHLEVGQRAMIATTVKPMLEVEAKKRQGMNSNFAHDKEIIPEHAKGQSRDQADQVNRLDGPETVCAGRGRVNLCARISASVRGKHAHARPELMQGVSVPEYVRPIHTRILPEAKKSLFLDGIESCHELDFTRRQTAKNGGFVYEVILNFLAIQRVKTYENC